jgi:hypothetical protein
MQRSRSADAADDTDHALFGVVAQVTKTTRKRDPFAQWHPLDPEPKLVEMIAVSNTLSYIVTTTTRIGSAPGTILSPGDKGT